MKIQSVLNNNNVKEAKKQEGWIRGTEGILDNDFDLRDFVWF